MSYHQLQRKIRMLMDAEIKQELDAHLSENISASSALSKIGMAIGISILAALAPVLIEFLPQLPHLIQGVLPEGIYRLLEPGILILVNLLIAYLATLARKDVKKGVTAALATPTPDAIAKFYEGKGK